MKEQLMFYKGKEEDLLKDLYKIYGYNEEEKM